MAARACKTGTRPGLACGARGKPAPQAAVMRLGAPGRHVRSNVGLPGSLPRAHAAAQMRDPLEAGLQAGARGLFRTHPGSAMQDDALVCVPRQEARIEESDGRKQRTLDMLDHEFLRAAHVDEDDIALRQGFAHLVHIPGLERGAIDGFGFHIASPFRLEKASASAPEGRLAVGVPHPGRSRERKTSRNLNVQCDENMPVRRFNWRAPCPQPPTPRRGG